MVGTQQKSKAKWRGNHMAVNYAIDVSSPVNESEYCTILTIGSCNA